MTAALLPRVGIGVDVHPFSPDRPLWLAGLHWPGEPGLAGHSDADVVIHALCNALLSAVGLGDLGTQFGTAEPEWRDAAGVRLLTETVRLVRDAGYAVGNAAVQLIGERPKLRERRTEAERLLTETVGAPIALSAATTDGLGFLGRRDGLAAVATALVFPAR
ncbi:MAG: 2-C-methyl-D-erythritol 2,4-cyclodiphosphate synthase [Acidothermus cellulolyticus]|nr:2-C-methyl-D-erythritol 2,4-cyclodiphosphate synthase [Acidothermus cellulolyticus]